MLSRFHVQLRYKAANFIHNITFEIHYINNTVNFPLVTTQSVLLESTNHHILSDVVLHKNGNYSITITNTGSHRLLIDSLAMLAGCADTVVYKNSNNSIKRNIEACWNESMVSMTMDVTERCQPVVFSSTAELFNGAIGW